eukprot:3173486-Alexandrium_andersonii.AAC.1
MVRVCGRSHSPASTGPLARPLGEGSAEFGLGRPSLRPGPQSGVQCRPPHVVGHLRGSGPRGPAPG